MADDKETPIKTRCSVRIQRIDTFDRMGQEYQRVADTGNPRDGGIVYEYVNVVKRLNDNRDIYEQEVDSLDLPAVIRAVNGL